MQVLTYSVLSSADDAQVASDGSGLYSSTQPYLNVGAYGVSTKVVVGGYYGSPGLYLSAFESVTTPMTVGLRFRSLSVPPGSTITHAYLRLFSLSKSNDTVVIEVSANAVDNAVAFSGGATPASRAKTTSRVTWDMTGANWKDNDWNESPDLKDVLQEVVDRDGWNINSSVAFMLADAGSTPLASHSIGSYDAFQSDAAVLYVEYDGPDAFVPQSTDPNKKVLSYKVYSPDWEFLGEWNDVVTEFNMTRQINSAGTSLDFELARNSDTRFTTQNNLATQAGDRLLTQSGFYVDATGDTNNQLGPGTTVALNNIVVVTLYYGQYGHLTTDDGLMLLTEDGNSFVGEIGAPQGRQMFTGYISRYKSRYGSSESTVVSVMSFGDELQNYVIEDTAGNTSLAYNSWEPSDIARDVMNKYQAEGGTITYDSTSIDSSTSVVSYTFNMNTTMDGIKKVVELLPGEWYWYVDMGYNKLYIKKRTTTPNHTFVLGKHIETLELEQYIEDIVNVVYFTGGSATSGGPNLFRKYVNNTSINQYRRGLELMSDNRVTDTVSADILGNNELDLYGAPRYQSSVTILDEDYDVDTIRIGDVAGFANFGNFIDDLGLQIVEIKREKGKATLRLDTLLPSINKRVQDIKRNLDAVQNQNNPTAPA